MSTPDISAPAEPAEPWNSNDEGQITDSDSETTQSTQRSTDTSRTTITAGSNKRVRSNSNDESSDENTNDTRHESSRFSDKSDYKQSTRIYSRGRGDEWSGAISEDRGSHRDTNEHNGRGRYDNFRGGEGRGYPGNHDDRVAESYVDASVFCKKKLWVGGLPSDITCEEIRKYFEAYGKLIYVMVGLSNKKPMY